MSGKKCIYCGQDKPLADFSDEHIWPDALGGDFLEPFWRTGDVCGRCNNLAGVFVDGAFIKGLFGGAERASGVREYIDIAKPDSVRIPLDYCCQLTSALSPDEIGEYWAGPCGAIILHIRPTDKDDQWASYAGGDPRAKKINAGRAYMALTSGKPFWVHVAVNSFKAHFKRAQRFVTNLHLESSAAEDFKKYFKTHFPDLSDPTQARDMEVMNQIIAAGKNKTYLKGSSVIQLDIGTRMLAKLALAVGYKLFGTEFLNTTYADILRRGLWERDASKRKHLSVHGTGYLRPQPFDLKGLLGWPGGWVLIIKIVGRKLTLTVVTPIGRTMCVEVTDSALLLDQLDPSFTEGNLWLTIPTLSRSEGPIWLPDYLAHRAGTPYLPVLTAIEAMRIDPTSLPPCQ